MRIFLWCWCVHVFYKIHLRWYPLDIKLYGLCYEHGQKEDCNFNNYEDVKRIAFYKIHFLCLTLWCRGVYSSKSLKKFPHPLFKTLPKLYYCLEEKNSLGKGIFKHLEKIPPALEGGGDSGRIYNPALVFFKNLVFFQYIFPLTFNI